MSTQNTPEKTPRELIEAALNARPTADDYELCFLAAPKDEIGKYVQACVDVSGGANYYFVRAVSGGVAVDVAHYGNGPTSNVNGNWACVASPKNIRALLAAHDAEIAALKAAQPVQLEQPILELSEYQCYDCKVRLFIGSTCHMCGGFSAEDLEQTQQPAPAAPYQVTDEDVEKALGIYYAIFGLDEFAEDSLRDMRKTLEAHEARKAAA